MASKNFEDKVLEFLERMTAAVEEIAVALTTMSDDGVKVTGTGAYISPYDENEEPPDFSEDDKAPETPAMKQPDE